ncbi:MAG TPA: hypothetical protein VJH03_05715 [Blastocatellia bacterium]|nr:hypothetical protein [Blastocatellia bacterium]
MKIDGVTALALVVIASFAIDRIVTAILFLGSFAGIVPDPDLRESGPERVRAAKAYKLIYFILAGGLGVVVLAYFGNVRILRAMGIQEATPLVDTLVTGLLLMGGAERLSQFIQSPGGSSEEKSAARPIEVTGTLKLEDDGSRKTSGHAG